MGVSSGVSVGSLVLSVVSVVSGGEVWLSVYWVYGVDVSVWLSMLESVVCGPEPVEAPSPPCML